MYEIGERVEIQVYRQESHFDRACETAYQYALSVFGANENGYLTNVKIDRSEATIFVEFLQYRRSASMGGSGHTYTFETWVEKNEC